MKDAKGQRIPSWARWVKTIAATAGDAGYKFDGGNYIPFGLYLTEESIVVFTTVDGASVTFTFGAGYHPIEFATITSTSTAALMLFAFDPTV
jgi:hypothetical protein